MKRIRCFSVAVLLTALAIPAGASTFLAMSREELVAKADSVVTGRVVEVNSHWNRAGTVIVTEAIVEVADRVLGNSASHVRVQTFGGQVGDQKIVADGFPTFRLGEKLLLFLAPDPAGDEPGFFKVLGYQQGQFRIHTDAKGRELAVPAWEADTVSIVKADGTTAVVPHTVPLSDLVSQIRETAQRVARSQAHPAE